MGITSRSVSLMRYRVRGEFEGSLWDAVDVGVKNGSFRETHSLGDVVAMGWTSVEDFTDASFETPSYAVGAYVALGLRIDTVRVPSKILEIHYRQESKKHLEETGRKRLSSTERRELKERLKETLRLRIFPSVQVFDLLWNTSTKTLYFGTHSMKARERFEDHFKKSFGLAVIPLIPQLRSEEILTEKSGRRGLEELISCSMV